MSADEPYHVFSSSCAAVDGLAHRRLSLCLSIGVSPPSYSQAETRLADSSLVSASKTTASGCYYTFLCKMFLHK